MTIRQYAVLCGALFVLVAALTALLVPDEMDHPSATLRLGTSGLALVAK